MQVLSILQRFIEPLPIRGKGRLANAILPYVGATDVRCHPVRGVTVSLRPDNWIERLMWAGAYEPELVSLFKTMLRPGMVVVDIGANIGYFSAIAAGLVGPSGQVHAFEPAPTCFSQLERNLSGFSWARAHRMAVSDIAGTANFHFSDKGNESGWGSLFRDRQQATQQANVVTATLDLWARTQAIQHIDFVKMDIEGGEFRALRGAEAVLAHSRPVIVAELNSVCLQRDSRKPEDVVRLLQSKSYDVFSFNDGILAIPQGMPQTRLDLKAFLKSPISTDRVLMNS